MRQAKKAALHAVMILAMLAVFVLAAGCGEQVANKQAPTGKPALLNFWQPG